MSSIGGAVAQDTSYFWLKRAHTLTGAMLGLVLLWYLAFGTIAAANPDMFNGLVATLGAFPLTTPFEILVVAVPITLHALMGLVIIYRSSANVTSYGYYYNWMYLLRRLSGFMSLAFLVIAAWFMRVVPAANGGNVSFQYVHALLGVSWIKIVCVLGVVALVFYITNGSTNALMTWGILQTKRSRHVAMIISWIAMIALWAWGLGVLLTLS